MAKRSHKTDSEVTLVKLLKAENMKLRRQNAKLKKIVSRQDHQQQHVIDLLESQEREDSNFMENFEKKQKKEKLEDKWKCHDCNNGILEIIQIRRPDGVYYLRKCNACKNRTRLQKWNEDVKGIYLNDLAPTSLNMQ